jgi:two-component system NtrC family sensor kinase
MLAAAWWSAGALLEHTAVSVPVKVFFAALEYLGIMAMAPLWLLFALDYAGRGRLLRGRRAAALAIVPLLTVALVWTNGWHHLVWTTITPSSAVPGAPLVYGHGPGFWLAAAYNYVLLVVGTAVLVATLYRAPAPYHGQTAALLIGVALPWIGNALYLGGARVLGSVDPPPLAFALTGVVFVVGLFRRRLFDLVPVARHALIESMADGVLVLDAQDRVIDVNPSARALLGLATPPIGEPAPRVLARWPALAAIIEGGDETESDARVETPRGAREIHARLSLLLDDRGRPRGRLLVLGDITDRKRTEETLRQTERLASLGRLLAGVAHELNNPLSVVIGHATLLKRDVSGPAAARIEKIAVAADRCARIVANFLAVARRREPDRVETDVNQVLRDAVTVLGHQLTADDVAVVLDLASALPSLHADAHQLHQVAVNLIANGHQAMLDRPLRVLTVSSRYDAAARRVAFTIADTGPGIPLSLRHHVFEPFFTTKPVGTGSGLGLSVCRGIVEAHEGTIEVSDAPGGGACVEVGLPLAAGGPDAGAGEAEPPADIIRGKRVLIVDDEPLVAGLLAELLEGDGHKVEVAGDGRAALERVGARGFDLIISDFKMPVLDGAGLYEGLVRHDSRLRERLVFISGDTLTPETRRFIESTGAPTVDKPFDAAQVRRVVQALLRRG